MRSKTLRLVAVPVALVVLIALASAMFGMPFAQAALPAPQALPRQTINSQQVDTSPVFLHKALHWTQAVSTYTAGSDDPENGQVLTGDLWVLTGSDGLPTFIHARYTSSDGTLVQDIVQTRTTEIDYFGKAYSIRDCTSSPHQSTRRELQSALPLFVTQTVLSAEGYLQGRTGSFQAFPQTPASGGVKPEQVYVSRTIAQSWLAKATYASGMRDVKTLDLDAGGRVLRQEVRLFDARNTLLQDNWHTYGSLQIYDPAQLPATTFAVNAQEKGVCHA